MQFIEMQLQNERQKTQKAVEEAGKLRERYLELMEVARQGAFEVEEESKEGQVVADYLQRENQHLREMLGIGRLTEVKTLEISAALQQEESLLTPPAAQPSSLETYKHDRFQRKTAALSRPIRSSFLFAPEKQHHFAGENGSDGRSKSAGQVEDMK